VPGSGCGAATNPNGCFFECMCSAQGFYQCGDVCEDAGPPQVDSGPGDVPDPCPGFAVPAICEVCSNGTTECAHAVLVNGSCQVEICP
jgi:hypothetical protein